MYYEEKVINGKTVYRTSPDGEWKPVSNASLTKALSSLREENKRLRGALDRLAEVAKTYGIFMAGVTPLNVLRSDDMQSEHKAFADGIQAARQALTKEG